MLHRYWFKFTHSTSPSILNLGCGITAYDEEDAKRLLQDKVFSVYGSRQIIDTIKDIDVSTLDENHVRSNMGSPANRGVWFPLM